MPSSEHSDAIVVGAGPVGLALAIGLAKKGYDVIVIERLSSSKHTGLDSNGDIADFEKSYGYRLCARSQKVFNDFGLLERLWETAVRAEGMGAVMMDTGGKTRSAVMLDGHEFEDGLHTGGAGYWLPRQRLLGLLRDEATKIETHGTLADCSQDVQEPAGASPGTGTLRLLFGVDVTDIQFPGRPDSENGMIEMTVVENDGRVAESETQRDVRRLQSRLLFGADGWRSRVRAQLSEDFSSLKEDGAQEEDWELVNVPSDSSGILVKFMPWFPQRSERLGSTRSEDAINMSGTLGRSMMSALPFCRQEDWQAISDKREPRRLIGRPCHPQDAAAQRMLSLKSVEEFYQHMRKEFPQLDLETLPEESSRVWIEGKGTVLPEAGYCKRAVKIFGSRCTKSAAVLVGDALHVIPPDLGQGVNAGLKDVGALMERLPRKGESPSEVEALWTALEHYGEAAALEAESLCKLIPRGMPYQYNQPFSFRQIAFLAELALRQLFSKLRITGRPAVFQVFETKEPREGVSKEKRKFGWKTYTGILEAHRRDGWVVAGVLFGVPAAVVAVALRGALRPR